MVRGMELHADGLGEELRRGGVLRRCQGSIRGRLAFQSACKDLGIDLRLTDSSDCRGICGRTGLGKVKDMAIQMLWLQDVVRRSVSEET